MMNLNKEGHSLAFPQVQSDLAEVVLWWSVWRVVGAGIGARSRKSLDMLHSKLRFGSPEPEALTVCLVSLVQRQISPLMCLLGWGRRRRSETQTLIAWHFGGIFNLCLCLICVYLGGEGVKRSSFGVAVVQKEWETIKQMGFLFALCTLLMKLKSTH